LLIAWGVLFGALSWKLPESFPTLRNLEMLARQTTIVSMAAIGMTCVIISGGIDLSVGSIVAFVSVVIALLLNAGVDPVLTAFAGVLVGGLCGLFNGSLVAFLRVGPFIVTLGSLLILRGAAKGLAGEQKIDAPLSSLSDLLSTLPAGMQWTLLPVGVWLMLALALIMVVVLKNTRFGRSLFAIGGNETAAIFSGLAVLRTKIWVYTVGGLFAGLAGLMLFSRLTVGDPTVAIGLELDVIAAVVIGGASLSGGSGSIAGSLLGALIMATIRSGGSQLGLPNWVQEIATGAIIVFAVAFDRFRTGASS